MANISNSFLQLTAGDLMMRDPITVTEDMPLRSAAEIFAQKQVSGVPVVDASGVCVGVLSASDFVHWVEKQTANQTLPKADPFYRVAGVTDVPEDPVRNWMTADPVTVPPDVMVSEIAQMMLDAHIHRVIVVDDQKRPKGIVSTIDVLAAIVRAKQNT